jgi:predicted dehydrogenase
MGIGRANARGFARTPRCTIAALCDLDEARMRDVADELKIEPAFFSDYRALCRSPEIDAIFVGTPNQLHVPIGLEAVRNGKHVLMTKPLADSLDPARTLVEAAEAAGVVGMMSLSGRFSAVTQYLGRLTSAGELGRVYYARSRSIRRSGIPSWSAGFIERGGGAWRDMGVHMLDAAWWLMGQPQPVSVAGVSGAEFGPRGRGFWNYAPQTPEVAARYAADDYAGGFIRFANGAGLQIESFWASHQPDETAIELFGTEGGARLDPFGGSEHNPAPLQILRTVGDAPADTAVRMPKGPDSWERIATHFVSCILDGTPCEAPLRHGLIVQEVLEALLVSAAEGAEVRIG